MGESLREVLGLRLAISQAATAKYGAILDRQVGGRMHHMFTFCGASRTGRWAGRGLQLQNLKRPPKDQGNEEVATALTSGTFDDLYGGNKAMETIGGAIRAAIKASPGKRLVVCDLASIESRVLGWVARDPKLQGVFQRDLDPYKAFAVGWLGLPYEQVTKEQRNLCKPPALGCGYGLGARGLVKYADSMGIEMDEETAGSAVGAFRRNYRGVSLFWREVEEAFVDAIAGCSGWVVRVAFFRPSDDMVCIRLPSGRGLYYHKPRVEPDGSGISYMGMNQYTRKWERIRTYGARLVENIVQAIARDILLAGMYEAEAYEIPIIGHVHDELIAEVETGRAEEALKWLRYAMNKVPAWGEGLILKNEGYVAERYAK